MKKLLIITALMCCVPAFIQAQRSGKSDGKSLVILWQHTVCQSKNPCERCLMAPQEVQTAYEELHSAFAKLDITVIYDEQTETQTGDHILINGKALEDLLGGRLLKRQCASCPSIDEKAKEYNALELDGTTYEIIPANLIIKAGLLAASDLFAAEPLTPCGTTTPCQECPNKH
ncbi:hypothetical protein AMJ74_02200 [candidate division WOR_3 bacterium SM1_77]|uniref:HMA domain-containing protein n=1 Tax=candidate division WOR_3 bacterium SM1_77 TaxID=1703778 RepID=A0A0S8K0C6_UNCW3|nr:MAG: hypothetical protein AMJ74_02200 [candidate division WOR_3 bacterium SM1_77]